MSRERVEGIGGLFFRARDPEALVRWYDEHLGIDPTSADAVWCQRAGPTVWQPFAEDTTKWPAESRWMVNFRVRDLDAMVAQLRSGGVAVGADILAEEGVGRFAWISDPEGTLIELWEPADDSGGAGVT